MKIYIFIMAWMKFTLMFLILYYFGEFLYLS
jgi:hypothetical protein